MQRKAVLYIQVPKTFAAVMDRINVKLNANAILC